MSSIYQVKPLEDLTIFTTPASKRKSIQFKASWSQTLKQLRSELGAINAKDAVLELAIQPRDIRLDGELRADARKPSHPGVRLSFHTKAYGDLSYTCDTYEGVYYRQMPDWQANVRAIVLTLERLRDVDRYGATKGEQYAGFKALPAGSGATPLGGMTKDQALSALVEVTGRGDEPEKLFRNARAKAHPDRHGGSRSLWDQVEQAGKVLGLV